MMLDLLPQFFELIITAYQNLFLLINSVFGSFGVSIIFLSFAVSFSLAPLIKLSNKLVNIENEYEMVLGPQLRKIKLESSREVQHSRIENLYKRYSYSPFYALRRVSPLFVQLPALILTYYMLDSLPQLQGVSFGLLKDLSQGDHLINGVNLLPFVMTLFNLIAAFTTSGFGKKDLTQSFIIAMLFLVILYDQSSALLLFWCINNAILMAKNIKGAWHTKRNENK